MAGVSKDNRREWGTGAMYQRSSDWRWVATYAEDGWAASGARKRHLVTGKGCEGGCAPRCSHRAAIKRKVEKKRAAMASGELVGDSRMTVKRWVDEYLRLRRLPPKPLSPKGWNAAASPLRKWVVPTIGSKALADLTPRDLRAVAEAQYAAGLKTSTADATQRAFITALNWAAREGMSIPAQVLMADSPGSAPSDRMDVPLEHALACLAVAEGLPHGIRWALTLLYGTRQGETLGLVETDPLTGEPCIDFDQHVIRLAWQLQTLKYVERGKPEKGFEVPRDHVSVHLHGAYHLVRPKSKAGIRVLPMLPPIEDALRKWLEQRPANPHGLVFPNAKGRPQNDKIDREEWGAIQCTAGVGHPGGRWWLIHECRNLAATQFDEIGASDNVITSMLGHASILTSRGYMTAHLDAKRNAVALVAERLGLAGDSAALDSPEGAHGLPAELEGGSLPPG